MNQARRTSRRRYARWEGLGLVYILLGAAGLTSLCAGLIFLLARP